MIGEGHIVVEQNWNNQSGVSGPLPAVEDVCSTSMLSGLAAFAHSLPTPNAA